MSMLRQQGFTLIEVAVAAAIVAVLAMIAMPLAEITAQRNRETELRIALRQIRDGIDAYKKAADAGRIAKEATATGYPPRLEMLSEGVEDITLPDKPKIHFLRRLPRDPFHADPQVSAAETWGKRAYASPPDAPMPGSDVYDVFSQSERIGLNGIPYRQW